MKTRIPLFIILFCLIAYLFMNMIQQKKEFVNQPAVWRDAGTEEERYLKFMRHVLPNGDFPPYSEFKEAARAALKEETVACEERTGIVPPAKSIYDPNVSRFSQQEVAEEIATRKYGKERYEKAIADRDQALIRRRMRKYEGTNTQGKVVFSAQPPSKDPNQDGAIIFYH